MKKINLIYICLSTWFLLNLFTFKEIFPFLYFLLFPIFKAFEKSENIEEITFWIFILFTTCITYKILNQIKYLKENKKANYISILYIFMISILIMISISRYKLLFYKH